MKVNKTDERDYIKTLIQLRSDLKDEITKISHRRIENKQPNATMRDVFNELLEQSLKDYAIIEEKITPQK